MREWIRRVLSRPVGVLVACVALLVLGVLSFANIPLQLLPEGFEDRSITVWAGLRDSSPAEAERFVAIPLEEALNTVAGIESLATRCERDSVRIEVELKSDADPGTVERDIHDRIARVEADLPDDVDRVRVWRRSDGDRPVMFFACTAQVDRLELSDFVEDVLLPRTEALDGVAQARSWGTLKRTVRIRLDQEEVARRQLDLRDLLRRLRGDNLSADLGDVREGDRTAFVRATMDFGSLEAIRDFPVLEGLRLGDLAKVEVVPALDEGWSRYNGNAVMVGTVYKRSGANTVDTCRRIRELFLDLQANRGGVAGLELIPFFDQGDVIEKSLGTLYENALYGGILAVGVLYFFFRRLRMTLLVAAAIPLSLTIAVTVLYLSGGSLNVATLMGLTLAVGMLIDNAIVVVEAILRRREAGEQPRPAAAGGTGEVALAVLTATLTTIVVVMPAIFLTDSDAARLWLTNIGGPIAYALLASLGVALVLVPLGSIWLRRGAAQRGGPGAVGRATRSRFGRFLAGALRQRFAVVALGIGVFLSAAWPQEHLGRKGAMGREGGPIRVVFRFPRHYTLSLANEAVAVWEKHVMDRLTTLGLEGIYARFDRYGGMAMMWKSPDTRRPSEEIREELKKDWPQVRGVWNSLETESLGGRTTVTLEGEDPSELERAMNRIEARLKDLPSVAETQRDRQQASLQELQVRLDPEARERGDVVADTIRSMIGWVVRGARLRDYRAKGRDLPLLVELDPEQAVELSDLGEVLIPTARGMRPLKTLTRVDIRNSAVSIERRDGRRVSEMQVVDRGDDDKGFHEEVTGVLREARLPPGVRFSVGGSWQELQETFASLFLALILGVSFVFILTGILFEAVLLPFAILFAIPPALAGGIWALYLTGKPMDELSYLGFILLVGVVVNNAIVLIDRVQQRRREGLSVRAAVAAAGRDRLRPVVMTALTTVVGLLPMAVFKGGQNEIPYDTLATAVIGGLLLSTVVTLVFVPVVFSLLVDLSRVLRGEWRGALRLWRTRPS